MRPELQLAATILGCDPADVVLLLRTCDSDRRDPGGFQCPESGLVEAPRGSGGIYGFLWGVNSVNWETWEKEWWMVVAAVHSEVIDLVGMVKVPRCVVLCSTRDQYEATQFLYKRPPPGMYPIPGITLTGGKYTFLMGGDISTLKAGDYARLFGNNGSELIGGYRSLLIGGARSSLTGGDRAKITGGDHSVLTGGNDSTLTAEDGSTLTGGKSSILMGGNYSTLTGGDDSVLSWRWWDEDGNRYRITTIYIGEDGYTAGTAYTCIDGMVSEASQTEET